jgi:hypothetical protein
MLQITRNYWWTLVLVLVLAFSCAWVVTPSAVVHASGVGTIDDPVGGPGGGGGGGTAGYGDPDVPVGAAKHVMPLKSQRGIVVGSARVAGDGAELSDPRMWRLQTLVLLMRGYIFRF